MKDKVKAMIDKAAQAQTADDALKFSQAACNAANALRALMEVHTGAEK
jgi:hypothetical protein